MARRILDPCVRLHRRLRDRERTDRGHGYFPGQGRVRRDRHRHPRERREPGKGKYNTAKLLGGPQIDHYHQAVAVVVAETFEQARSAAELIKVDYEQAKGSFDLADGRNGAKTAPVSEGGKPETSVGDFWSSLPHLCNSTRRTPHPIRPTR